MTPKVDQVVPPNWQYKGPVTSQPPQRQPAVPTMGNDLVTLPGTTRPSSTGTKPVVPPFMAGGSAPTLTGTATSSSPSNNMASGMIPNQLPQMPGISTGTTAPAGPIPMYNPSTGINTSMPTVGGNATQFAAAAGQTLQPATAGTPAPLPDSPIMRGATTLADQPAPVTQGTQVPLSSTDQKVIDQYGPSVAGLVSPPPPLAPAASGTSGTAAAPEYQGSGGPVKAAADAAKNAGTDADMSDEELGSLSDESLYDWITGTNNLDDDGWGASEGGAGGDWGGTQTGTQPGGTGNPTGTWGGTPGTQPGGIQFDPGKVPVSGSYGDPGGPGTLPMSTGAGPGSWAGSPGSIGTQTGNPPSTTTYQPGTRPNVTPSPGTGYQPNNPAGGPTSIISYNPTGFGTGGPWSNTTSTGPIVVNGGDNSSAYEYKKPVQSFGVDQAASKIPTLGNVNIPQQLKYGGLMPEENIPQSLRYGSTFDTPEIQGSLKYNDLLAREQAPDNFYSEQQAREGINEANALLAQGLQTRLDQMAGSLGGRGLGEGAAASRLGDIARSETLGQQAQNLRAGLADYAKYADQRSMDVFGQNIAQRGQDTSLAQAINSMAYRPDELGLEARGQDVNMANAINQAMFRPAELGLEGRGQDVSMAQSINKDMFQPAELGLQGRSQDADQNKTIASLIQSLLGQDVSEGWRNTGPGQASVSWSPVQPGGGSTNPFYVDWIPNPQMPQR